MSEKPKTVPWPYKLFFVFHLLMITLWCMPAGNPDIMSGRITGRIDQQFYAWNDKNIRFKSPSRNYLISTGLWQYWDMFSPNPLAVDSYLDVRVVFDDQTIMLWPYPRMANMALPDRYFHERFRKNFERTGMDNNRVLWPAFCQKIALDAYRTRGKMPIEVTLITRYRNVGPPQNDPNNTKFGSKEFYRHIVETGAIRAVAGEIKPK